MKAAEILALVRAHNNNDHERFRSLILVVAANAEKQSPNLAKQLRALAEKATTAPQFTQPGQKLQSLLLPSHPTTELADMRLEGSTWVRLERVIAEQAARDKFAEHGLEPARKLLFVGPPGVGKTMMASVLAHELGIPLMRVELHGVISSHLGETAAHLAQVFQSVRSMRGVYLFDEFDALAGSRSNSNRQGDVGEMRRVCNSLLQFIEQDVSDSLIIAATNHNGLIDDAMYRRFDEVIEFPLPSREICGALIRSQLIAAPSDLNWIAIQDAAVGLGHADIVAACNKVNKDCVILDTVATTSQVLGALASRSIARVEVCS